MSDCFNRKLYFIVTEVGDSKLTGSSWALGDLIGLGFLVVSTFTVFCLVSILFSFEAPVVASGESSLLVFLLLRVADLEGLSRFSSILARNRRFQTQVFRLKQYRSFSSLVIS